MAFYFSTLIILFACKPIAFSYPRSIPIGIIYNEEETFVARVIEFFNSQQNKNAKSQLIQLTIHSVALKQEEANDAWTLMKTVCDLLKKGIFALISSGHSEWHATLSALSKEMHLPLIHWTDPPDRTISPFELSTLPSTSRVIAEIIQEKKWSSITYVYLSSDGLSMFSEIFQHLAILNFTATADILQLPSTGIKVDFEKAVREVSSSCARPALPERHVVLLYISPIALMEKTLMALRKKKNGISNCHYLIASLGMNEKMMETFKDGSLNITAVEQINEQNRIMTDYTMEFAKELRFKSRSNLFSSEAAHVHDSIVVVRTGIEKLLRNNQSLFYGSFRRDQYWNSGYPGIYCVPAEDLEHSNRIFKPFDFGRQIADNLKMVAFEGLTGVVQFNSRGKRRTNAFNVLEVKYSGRTLVTSFTKSLWKQGVGLLTDKSTVNFRRIQSKNLTPVNNSVRIVTAYLNAPFVMYKEDAKNYEGNEKFEGYCVDLIKLLSEKIDNFPYEIQLTKDGRTGSMTADGTWDGMIGTLLRGEADMAVASLVSNTARERVVDFSKPFMTTGISIMIKKPDTQQQNSLFAFMQPLSTEVWMYILFAYIGISVVLYFVSRFTVSEWKVSRKNQSNYYFANDFSVCNCLWFILATFMHQGIDILPRSTPGRIASSAWWFFTLIIVSSYTANLAAFLTLEKMHAPIESAEDMAKQTKIKYGIQSGGSTAQFFEESTVQTYQRMWQFMTSQSPSVFVPSYDAGIARVRESKGRYAFLLEATTNDYTNNRKPCDTMKVGGLLNTVGYGIATPFGSELKSRINLAILELQEKGELKKLENKWWYEKSGGLCKTGPTGSSKASLTQNKIVGIFYILIAGILFSIIVSFVEFLHKSRVYARQQKITFYESIKHIFAIAYHGKPKEMINIAEMH